LSFKVMSQFSLLDLSPSWGAASCAAKLKNFPEFYGTRRFITVFTRALHWSLSWARSIQSIPSHPISLRSISIFFRLGRLSKESVQVRGFLWSFVTSLFFTMRSCEPHSQPPCWMTIPWRRLLHPQPEDASCRGGKGPT
jgi:hypothetical protein